jgi:Rrf2 family protein
MRLSRESEYGVEGMRVLATQPAGTVMLLEDIAEAGDLPVHFLAKIFQKLGRHQLVQSHRGAVRGYSLGRAAHAITMREIVEAIEGPGLFERCAFWPSHCDAESPCPIHRQWGMLLRPALKQILDGITLAQIASAASRPAARVLAASGGEAPPTCDARRRPMRFAARRAKAVLLCFVLLATMAGPVAALTPDGQRGEALFQQRCIACHTVGQGDRVGPDLAGVGARRDREWLARWIAGPDRMLAAKDPVASALLQKYGNVPMPNQGLTADEVAAVIAYLTAAPGMPTAPAPGVTTAPAPPATAAGGDAAAGKQLFTGTRRLRNGGPPCMACHSIAGIGTLGGGALGPDLTTAVAKYGPSGLASVLATIPFPTMTPIFGGHPLAPDEQADLHAFIAGAPVTGRAPGAIGRLSALAVAGTAVLLGLAQLRWRHRLGGIRARMVNAARARATGGSTAPSRRS